MGGTYEEGHMLTFKIILLVILGSAGNKQNKTAAGRSLHQHQKYPHCPLLVVVWYRITPYFDVFFRKMGSIIHRASQKTLGGNLSKIRRLVRKHRKNCKCCPGNYVIVNHYSSMSWFKFRNLSVVVNCVTKSLIHYSVYTTCNMARS